ncbi:hypothetical protein [Chitinophaga sp.]|uniref:hypothetical protein n=1 Tax=Chitinophaga sp. TaxID=1869181 RepID=UPI002C92F796|nr:hypothetical protein [Chitinophaga sp.]HWV70019.1 hypothetical protein [Chitinophaga sp.]
MEVRYLLKIQRNHLFMPLTNQEQMFFCLLFIAGCMPPPSPEEKTITKDTVATAVIAPSEQQMVMPADSLPVDIEEDSLFIPADAEIRVLTASKVITSRHDVPEFRSWKLSNADIEKIFRNSQPTDGPTIHYRYNTLECEVKGEVMINKETYHYTINAGAYFYLYNRHHSYTYICPAENCRSLFLDHGQSPEED